MPGISNAHFPCDIDASFAEGPAPAGLTLGSLLASVWRRRFLFVAASLLTFGVAVAIILSLQPRYDAQALLMVDPRQTNISNFRSLQDLPTLSDLNFVRSQMQILTSDELAHRVVVDMNLQQDPGLAMPQSMLAQLIGTLPESLVPDLVRDAVRATEPGTSTAHPVPPVEAAVGRYKSQFGAFSDGKSFIISASFSAADPAFAQRVLARHLALFQADQVAAKNQLINQATKWFSSEIDALHAKLLSSEAQQQAFRRNNQLIRTGGETIPSRQLTALTLQLSDARADLGRKEARQQQLSAAASSKSGADTATLSSELIMRLREREAGAAQRVAQMERSFGPAYPPLMSERGGLADIQARISRELDRLTASAASDAAIARVNVAQLETALNDVNNRLGETTNDEVKAAQLERDIEVDRHLYDDLLLRFKQVSIQGQLQEPDTRIVSAPMLPLQPSFPRKTLLFAISLMAATLVGGASAVLADLLGKRKAMALGEVEATCGVAGLAVIPWVRAADRWNIKPPQPGSHLSAAIQRLTNSISFRCMDRNPQVTVFVSALPGEGRTVVSTLYARALANGGKKVLLIDADFRRHGLTRSLAASADRGLADCLTGMPLDQCITHDEVTGVDILPTGRPSSDPGALLAADRIDLVLQAARQEYAAIVIDTPPITVVDDALQLVAQADATVMVARWNRTPLDTMRKALGRVALTGSNVVGVTITATDMRKYRSGADTPTSFAQSEAYYITKV